MEETLSYLDQLKSELRNQPEVVDDFLSTFEDYLSGSLDIPAVARRVSNLLRGHRELIVRINKYFPPEHRIDPDQQEHVSNPGSSLIESTSLTPLVTTQQATASSATAEESPVAENPPPNSPYSTDEQRQSNSVDLHQNSLSGGNLTDNSQVDGVVSINVAIKYMCKVKATLVNRPDVCEEFLLALKEFLNFPKTSPTELFHRISNIFCDYPELVVGFKVFLKLPDESPLGSIGATLTPARTTQQGPSDISYAAVESSPVENGRTSPGKSLETYGRLGI